MSRLLEQYNNQIKQDLKSKLGLKNLFEVPKIKKKHGYLKHSWFYMWMISSFEI